MPLILECIDPHGERAKAIRSFYAFACERLGVVGGPKVDFTPHLGTTSFGLYSPSDDIVTVAVEGRHISDILRTFGHELVHHVQMATEHGRTVEDLEYEANAVAGMLMRDYNKLHPEMFGLSNAVDAPGTLGDSQGAVAPDTTRPSGPIELAELSNQTLASYKTKALRARKAGQKNWWAAKQKWPSSGRTGSVEWEFPNSGKKYPEPPQRTKGIETAANKLKARYAHLKEDGAVVNSAGSGAIAGLGIGPQGEPGIDKRKKTSPIMTPMVRRKTFKQLKEDMKPEQARKEFANTKKSRTESEEHARKALLKRIK